LTSNRKPLIDNEPHRRGISLVPHDTGNMRSKTYIWHLVYQKENCQVLKCLLDLRI